MKHREGPFTLAAVVGCEVGNPSRWHSAGFVHAEGESRYLEQVSAGTEFETREAATHAAIEAARSIARMLPADDSWIKRGSNT